MRRSPWLLLAVVLSLPAQAATECRDIRDRDLQCMCSTLECGDSGDCGNIDSRDLQRYYGTLLTPGQHYDYDDIRDGDMYRQRHAIVHGDRERCDDIDSRNIRCQCQAVVPHVSWQCDGINDRGMRRICRVILPRQMPPFIGTSYSPGSMDFTLSARLDRTLRYGTDSSRPA